ncbi:MAG: septal ring lytic transglycosylase RlpA family protein [Pseudomonadales bacterium]|nr:septal ring lytic transglycosylase RlpA family protein [Pseudomonadales bacterium]
MRSFLPLALIGALTLVIVACSSQPVPTPEPAPAPDTSSLPSRYQHARDGAPPMPIDAADVHDAVPRPDPILTVGNMSPYTIDGVTYEVLDDHTEYRVRGTASWYGAKFHGHETSNGEIYNLYLASAAHKTLPIPCYARVTNLANGKSIIVRVNDRGPFHSDRVIDLSYGAAVKLGYMEAGTTEVEVAVLNVVGVDDRRGSVAGDYRYLQLGAYSTISSAQRLQDKLQELLESPVFVSEVQSGESLLYRVRVGPMTRPGEIQDVQELLRTAGYDGGQPLP